MKAAKDERSSWKERRFPRLAPALRLIGASRSPQPEVRSFCPFCGAANPTPEEPCCGEWQRTAELESAGEAEAPRLGAVWHTVARSVTGWRLAPASNLLVALLASSIVAAGFSIATQWQIAIQRESELQAARLLSREFAVALGEARLRNDELSRLAAAASADAANPPVPAAPATTSHVETTSPSSITQETAALAASDVQPPEIAAKTDAGSSPPAAVGSAARGRPSGAKPAEPAPPQIAPPAPPSAAEAVRHPEVASVPPPAESRSTAIELQPEELAKWQQLRRGMSRAAVRALLGEPKWKDRSLHTEFWLYTEDSILGRGWVAFYDANGPVFGWREP